MKRLITIYVAAILILGYVQTSRAALLYTGTRSTASADQLVTDDEWSVVKGGMKIDFTVEWTGSFWSYDYILKDADGTPLDPEITRFLKLGVSDISDAWFKYISDGHTPGYDAGDEVPITPDWLSFHLWDVPASDPSYSLYCLYIGDNSDQVSDELSDGHLTILSSQGPKWGSFYARDGDPYGSYDGPAEAVNRGFNGGVFPNPSGGMYSAVGTPPAFDPGQDMNGPNVKYWILVPDTYVPEPATLGLLLVGGLVLLRRRQTLA